MNTVPSHLFWNFIAYQTDQIIIPLFHICVYAEILLFKKKFFFSIANNSDSNSDKNRKNFL